MITLKEIARICGVSTATVSNVINGKAKAGEKTKARILQVIEETGYRPNIQAKGLRTGRYHTIGVVAEDIAQFTSPEIISGIMEQCEAQGYRVVLYNMRMYGRLSDTWYDDVPEWHRVLDPIMQNIFSSGYDGVIYLAGHARHLPHTEYVPPIPAVCCYTYSDHPRIPSVVLDDEAAAREMTSYLIACGHHRIGLVGGRENNLHTILRLRGYREALEEAGIPYDPALVYYANWDRASGREAAKQLCGRDITAVFSMADRMAGGVYDYLEETGRVVNRNLSVAGFDDESIAAYFRPALTTMALPLERIGRTAASCLIDLLAEWEGGKKQTSQTAAEPIGEPQVIRVPCTFIKRSSVTEI